MFNFLYCNAIFERQCQASILQEWIQSDANKILISLPIFSCYIFQNLKLQTDNQSNWKCSIVSDGEYQQYAGIFLVPKNEF